MDKKNNIKTGNLGEDIAAKFLVSLGYKILERNYKLFLGEIDILANPPTGRKRTIVLVEVKTIRGEGFGLAKDLVRFKKQKKLRNIARALLQEYPNKTIRIDVIGVHLYIDPPKVEHIISAVEN